MITKTLPLRLGYVVFALPVLLTMLALLALFGPGMKVARADSPSFVRIIHASPDVGTADVFLDGSKLLSSFAFGSVTDYATIPAGPHKVQIALVGKGVGGAALSQTLNVSPGVAYTVAAIGTASSGVSLKVFIDNNQFTPGTAKLRIYHLAPDLGTVNVSNGGGVNVSDIAYPQASDYQSVKPGTYKFTFTSTQNSSTYSLSTTLSANKVTSIFAVGLLNGTPRFSLTTAQTNGLPGMPGTGSDPHAVSTLSSSGSPVKVPNVLPWLIAGACVLLLGGSVVIGRRVSRVIHR